MSIHQSCLFMILTPLSYFERFDFHPRRHHVLKVYSQMTIIESLTKEFGQLIRGCTKTQVEWLWMVAGFLRLKKRLMVNYLLIWNSLNSRLIIRISSQQYIPDQ